MSKDKSRVDLRPTLGGALVECPAFCLLQRGSTCVPSVSGGYLLYMDTPTTALTGAIAIRTYCRHLCK